MQPVHRLLLACALAFLVSGCVSFSSYPKPVTDKDAELAELSPLLKAEVLVIYGGKEDEVAKRAYRDEVLNARIRAVNIRFTEFVQGLDIERRKLNIGTDWALLGLNGTASLITPASTKSILSALSAGVVGGKGSVDKNLFFDKTMPVLIAQMEANRRQVLLVIRKGMNRGVDKYPLSNGLIDVEDYYMAGSLNAAITAIGASSGEAIKDSEAGLKKAASSGYTDDAAGQLLNEYWQPKGVTDKEHEAALQAWLKKNGHEGEIIPYFTQAAEFTELRVKAVADLNLNPN